MYKHIYILARKRLILVDFSSLVLMERNKETNAFVKELGSYKVHEGAAYVTKFFYDGEKVHMVFDTKRDVEEWEYSAIFDLFSSGAFEDNGFSIEELFEEYNPTWVLRFDYVEEHNEMEEKINEACTIIEEELDNVFEAIKGKQEDYEEQE
jgi:carboxylesterase type B